MTTELLRQVTIHYHYALVKKSWSARGKASVEDIASFLVKKIHDYALPGVRIVPISVEVIEYVPVNLMTAKSRRYVINFIGGHQNGTVKH